MGTNYSREVSACKDGLLTIDSYEDVAVSTMISVSRESARGLAQSKTYRNVRRSFICDSVLDCASPLALFIFAINSEKQTTKIGMLSRRSCGAASDGSPRRQPWEKYREMTEPREGRKNSCLAHVSVPLGWVINPVDRRFGRRESANGMKRTAIEMVVILVFVLPLVYWVRMPRTWYPPGYSEKNFSKIKLGMSTNEVLTLIGSPSYCPDGAYWQYSHPGGSVLPTYHWNARSLIVSNGVVAEIIKGEGIL
jgi:hypothetical protein